MSDANNWFTERSDELGCGFTLRIEEKLHDEQSDFQRIEVYKTATYGNLMTIDGLVMLTSRDNFLYHEMMSHPALYSHPAPKDVLIIGGGDCGTLREVLKHDCVKSATQVDIDERVTRVSEVYFPELCESNDDPRANLQFDDGIKWVADATAGSYDIIIIDSTDPVGPAEGLFTSDFYKNCLNALRDKGILIAQSESPLLHAELIKSMRENLSRAGFDHVSTLHFPQSCYPSGWWSATMAGKNNYLADLRTSDVRSDGFETSYFTLDILQSAQALPAFLLNNL
jgi:spermidine synthase